MWNATNVPIINTLVPNSFYLHKLCTILVYYITLKLLILKCRSTLQEFTLVIHRSISNRILKYQSFLISLEMYLKKLHYNTLQYFYLYLGIHKIGKLINRKYTSLHIYIPRLHYQKNHIRNTHSPNELFTSVF